MMEPTKRSPPEEISKGLICRDCGCRHFEVVYTRPAPRGRIVRRRACRHCGRRVTTVEQMLGQVSSRPELDLKEGIHDDGR